MGTLIHTLEGCLVRIRNAPTDTTYEGRMQLLAQAAGVYECIP